MTRPSIPTVSKADSRSTGRKADKREPIKTPEELLTEQISWVSLKLSLWSRYMAARFGAPVRLIGSVLWTLTPRDVDIRVVIPNEQFAIRYGSGTQAVNLETWKQDPPQKWIDDMASLNQKAVRSSRENIDFQVWPERDWRDDADHRAPPIILAAPTVRVYVKRGKQ